MLKMHWQKHGVGRLQQNQEIPAVGFSCYLMTFSAFELVGTRVLNQMQRRSINDCSGARAAHNWALGL